MKKVILSCLFFAILVSGCNDDKAKDKKESKKDEKTTVCTYSDQMDKMIEYEMVFVEKDGKLISLYENLETNMSLDPDMKVEAFVSMLEENKEMYKESNEFTYDYEETDENVYVEHLIYNVEDYEPEALLADSLLDKEKYSLKYAVKALEDEGYTCKTK
ncbi:hypothetical protein M2475_001792 [Breznakia sp. PF5-3]|uniref:hypothetical protein n=1 Tax=unclassified Breznakia TaxID=2623764 RepID=UPI0024062E33|nr:MULTISPECIES: hypothetical protein [unclassified Breznakia]MDL2276738.1 hypothetical protein [Breznakia sp. OttesenSCG-928-G09]MDF9825301.1 hypothetical protein [Breznakia sp. PM6-1]MDF9836216.1 hypothetical protein [Breznakia sp. PF5-3]MDF9838445.1 hypothetical protein [Breznakia sp. PFB2-8]MDF9860461.1 hypothetical protein [Breznakia sp. PH5-24]